MNINGQIVGIALLNDAFDQRPPLLQRMRIGQPDAVERLLQSSEVFVDAEGTARIDRDNFVSAVAKQKTTVERRNFRFVQWQKLPVQISRHPHPFKVKPLLRLGKC